MIQQPDFQILTVWWLSNLSQYLIIFSNFFHPFLKYHVSDPVPGKRSGSAGFILYQDISSKKGNHDIFEIDMPDVRSQLFAAMAAVSRGTCCRCCPCHWQHG